jgi:hypothetical protein
MPDESQNFNSNPVNPAGQGGPSGQTPNPFSGATEKSPLEQTSEAKKIEDAPTHLPESQQEAPFNASPAPQQTYSSPAVSPLEGTTQPTPPSDMPAAPVAPAPAVGEPVSEPVVSPAPVDPVEEEPVKAPDTDEFLKKILQEAPQAVENPAEAKTEPIENLDSKMPDVFNQPSSEPTPAPVNEPVNAGNQLNQENTDGSISFDANPTPKISDDITGLSDLNSGPQPVGEPQAEPVTSDVIGAMQKKTPSGSKGGTTKLIGLAVLAVILVAGGYVVYNSFLSNNNTTVAGVSPTTGLASATEVALSPDDARKKDLISLQSVLQDYWTNENKYPISNEMISLGDAGNVLEQALVPVYLSALPADPDSTKHYAYKSDGTTYTLSAILDSTTDPNAVMENGSAVLKVTPETKMIVTEATATETASTDSTSISSPPVPTLPTN